MPGKPSPDLLPYLADPGSLAVWYPKSQSTTSGIAKPGTELLQVVVETPRGSRNKYSYDEERRVFQLKSTLPAGMTFPFDFGFVPGTKGGDDDPLDVLLLLEEPCFPGCAVLAHLIGVLETEQTEAGETFRNDRLIAVADSAVLYSSFRSVDDLPQQLRAEIEAFFLNYHSLHGKSSRHLGWKGPADARTLVDTCRRDG